MAQTLLELEQLLSQKNLRRIAEEPGRFLAATQGAPPEKQAQIKKILQDFKAIEAALGTVTTRKKKPEYHTLNTGSATQSA
jgi:hypothetical protein